MTNDDELAYDGSNYPQKRELTARERDIICRMMNEAIRIVRGYSNTPIHVFVAETDTYQKIMDAIDPRVKDS